MSFSCHIGPIKSLIWQMRHWGLERGEMICPVQPSRQMVEEGFESKQLEPKDCVWTTILHCLPCWHTCMKTSSSLCSALQQFTGIRVTLIPLLQIRKLRLSKNGGNSLRSPSLQVTEQRIKPGPFPFTEQTSTRKSYLFPGAFVFS